MLLFGISLGGQGTGSGHDRMLNGHMGDRDGWVKNTEERLASESRREVDLNRLDA